MRTQRKEQYSNRETTSGAFTLYIGDDWSAISDEPVVAVNHADTALSVTGRLARVLGVPPQRLTQLFADGLPALSIVGLEFMGENQRVDLLEALRSANTNGRVKLFSRRPMWLPGVQVVQSWKHGSDRVSGQGHDSQLEDAIFQTLAAFGQPCQKRWLQQLFTGQDVSRALQHLEVKGSLAQAGNWVVSSPSETDDCQLEVDALWQVLMQDGRPEPNREWMLWVYLARHSDITTEVTRALETQRLSVSEAVALYQHADIKLPRHLAVRAQMNVDYSSESEPCWLYLFDRLVEYLEQDSFDLTSEFTREVCHTPQERAVVRCYEAFASLRSGNLRRARMFAEQSRRDLLVFENQSLQVLLGIAEAEIALLSGDAEFAIAHLEAAWEQLDEHGQHSLARLAATELAVSLIYLGQTTQAQQVHRGTTGAPSARTGRLLSVCQLIASADPTNSEQIEAVNHALFGLLTPNAGSPTDLGHDASRPVDLERFRAAHTSSSNSLALTPSKCNWAKLVYFAKSEQTDQARLSVLAAACGSSWQPHSSATGMFIDAKAHRILRDGQEIISLRRRKVLRQLLYELCRHPKQALSKEELVERVWMFEYHPLRHDATLFTNIMRLRRLLGDSKGDLVRSVDGGYMWWPTENLRFAEEG